MRGRKTEVHFALVVISSDCFHSLPISHLSPAIRSRSWSAAAGKATLLSSALLASPVHH